MSSGIGDKLSQFPSKLEREAKTGSVANVITVLVSSTASTTSNSDG
jgi:hypothetical protein